MIYRIELLSKILDELLPLFKSAWEEVDQLHNVMDLDPDWDKIFQLEKLGMWRTYTVRTESGELVGYICVVIDNLIHSKGNYHSVTDVAYIKPEYRGDFKTLLGLVEGDLSEEGVRWFTINLKSWDKRGGALEKSGYTHYENVYQKLLVK